MYFHKQRILAQQGLSVALGIGLAFGGDKDMVKYITSSPAEAARLEAEIEMRERQK